jgi:transposase-like protein
MNRTSSPLRHYKQKIGLTTTTFRKWRHTSMRGRRTTPGTAATYHARGTALESYERLKTNGTASDL